jgi:hypothetical protein
MQFDSEGTTTLTKGITTPNLPWHLPHGCLCHGISVIAPQASCPPAKQLPHRPNMLPCSLPTCWFISRFTKVSLPSLCMHTVFSDDWGSIISLWRSGKNLAQDMSRMTNGDVDSRHGFTVNGDTASGHIHPRRHDNLQVHCLAPYNTNGRVCPLLTSQSHIPTFVIYTLSKHSIGPGSNPLAVDSDCAPCWIKKVMSVYACVCE